jgi:hypothetical protein
VAVEAGTTLRDECRAVKASKRTPPVPVDRFDGQIEEAAEVQARPTWRVVREWRRWMRDYRGSHIEYESPDGETVRAPLENSYMESYDRRYYARLKDFERGVRREFSDVTTVMVTLTASHENANGGWRCPADHMRDVMDGWDAARKHLHAVLEGYRWEYVRILEPHADGYGHLHIGVVVEDPNGDLGRGEFAPVLDAHVRSCDPAGPEAHRVEGEDAAVSLNDDVENLGTYLSEYLGTFEGEALSRPMTEQTFYAVTWATNTRRLDFSNGAQEIIASEEFRRETGLRPEDRGGDSGGESGAESGAESEASGWEVDSLCSVSGGTPNYYDPTAGGVQSGPIDGVDGVDPPPDRGGPPPT